MSRQIRVAAIQSSCSSDVHANVEQACRQVRAAAAAGAQLICLQELFASLYPCGSEDVRQFDLAESIPGPTTELLAKLAAELEVVLIVPLFERRGAGLYHNSAVVIDADGERVGHYRKMHIPDDPGYYEKFYFAPGDLGFVVAETRFGRVGVCICWDQWFPEAARLTALRGAEVIVFPTAIGWLPEDKEPYGAQQVDAWRTMMRSHAIANGLFVVAANRFGREGGVEFWGNSFVCDPNGVMLASAGAEREEAVIADCDLDQIEAVRQMWPFLRDRRVDAYGGLSRLLLDDSDE